MVYEFLLIAHIAAGLSTFITAPAYLLSLKDGNTKPSSWKRRLIASISLTTLLGVSLMLYGASITYTCGILVMYLAVAVSALAYGARREMSRA